MFITISREYAAGGSEVAARVADQLGWTVLDNALVDQIAERSGLSPADVAALDERVPSFLERMARMSASRSSSRLYPRIDTATDCNIACPTAGTRIEAASAPVCFLRACRAATIPW